MYIGNKIANKKCVVSYGYNTSYAFSAYSVFCSPASTNLTINASLAGGDIVVLYRSL